MSGVVFLIGHMGSGKTSVGEVLGRSPGWRFEDLDDRIERRERRRIAQIFQESGERAFRKAEHDALAEALQEGTSPSVLALGGGAFAEEANRALIEAAGGITVWLDAPVQELWRRCQEQGKSRPLAADREAFGRLYESRRDAYARAQLHISTAGRRIEDVAAEVQGKVAGTMQAANLNQEKFT